MSLFSLARTIGYALTNRNEKGRLIWAVIAAIGLFTYCSEAVRAQEYCEGIGERLPAQGDSDCDGWSSNGPYSGSCSYSAGGYGFTRTRYNYNDPANCTQARTGFLNSGSYFSVGLCNSNKSGGRYIQLTTRTDDPCATGVWNGSICELQEVPGCLCTIDDLPIELGINLGHTGCDRPALQQCTSGEPVLQTEQCPPDCDSQASCTQQSCQNETDICMDGTSITSVLYDSDSGASTTNCGSGGNYCQLFNTPEPTASCEDYGSCLAEACSSGCPSGQFVDGFIHSSGSNYANSCSTGGNACGDNPNAPPDIDVEENNTPFTDADTTGTNSIDIAEAINEASERNNQNSTALSENIEQSTINITQAISEASESSDQNAGEIVASNDRIQATNEAGFEGLQETLDEFTNNEEDVDTGFYSLIQNAPILAAGNNLSNMFAGTGECPSFTLDIPQPLNTSITSSLHCEIYNSASGVLTAVFIGIYSFVGFRIIASA